MTNETYDQHDHIHLYLYFFRVSELQLVSYKYNAVPVAEIPESTHMRRAIGCHIYKAQVPLNTWYQKIPTHWGYTNRTDPVERVTKKAKELGMPVITPRIGDVVALDSLGGFGEAWWVGI